MSSGGLGRGSGGRSSEPARTHGRGWGRGRGAASASGRGRGSAPVIAPSSEQVQSVKNNSAEARDIKTLWLGSIKKHVSKRDLFEVYWDPHDCVVVRIVRKRKETDFQQRYGFLEFNSHKCALTALRRFKGTKFPSDLSLPYASVSSMELNWGTGGGAVQLIFPESASNELTAENVVTARNAEGSLVATFPTHDEAVRVKKRMESLGASKVSSPIAVGPSKHPPFRATLLLGNLPDQCDVDELKGLCGEVGLVEGFTMYEASGSAVVTYSCDEAAEMCVLRLHSRLLVGPTGEALRMRVDHLSRTPV